ncbi:dysbindin-like [Actinia tenebrosa]|uniref:Dysbindin-like n=1 Tax=Actinia tenebrosa TaxID=6105 RepID=A0A6P8HR44_ACTTE|nr:dysbindin-like [Actinia tenebrosa]
MFGSLKERLESVKHDVTQGWKSISDKAKAVNQKIARKTTFITEEYTEGQDQCFNCDLEAGSEILEKYHKDWADIHEKSRASAEEAESADQTINSILKKCTNLRNTMTIFHGELDKLPEVIQNIQSATETIAAIGTQSEELEDLLMDLEEVCEKLDIERHKNSHRLKVVMFHQSKLDDLEKLKEDLQLQHQINSQKKEKLERQESIERQKVYEDAFIEQMNYYIQFGKTDEHVSHSSEPEESLADIKLEDYDLEKQLDDFLGPNLQDQGDPSIPSKAPDRPKHKRKSPKSKSKTKQTETKSQGKSEEIEEVSATSAKEESGKTSESTEVATQSKAEPDVVKPPEETTEGKEVEQSNTEGEEQKKD